MGVSLNIYKNKIRNIILEVVKNNSRLNELFESPPFKSNFDFNEDSTTIYVNPFQDIQGNSIKIYFHKLGKDIFELDFTVNGSSFSNSDVNYSIKEYTSLLSTIAKCWDLFIEQYKPKGLRIEGNSSIEKQLKGKENQKNEIYGYFINKIKPNPNYSILHDELGNFEIIRKK
jgi:hypothetical protein